MHPGASCLVHSYAAAVVAERHAAGWGESGADRAYQATVETRTHDVTRLDQLLGPGAQRVWRAVLARARRQTLVRSVPVLAGVAGVAVFLPGFVWFFVGGVAATTGVRAWRSPTLKLSDHGAGLEAVIAVRPVRRAVRRHGSAMPARSFDHPVLATHLRAVLDELSPAHRELAVGLQPGFPGTVGELVVVSRDIAAS